MGPAARPGRTHPSAHAAPLVRHPCPAIVAGSSRRPGDARPRQHLDHAGLYAPRLPGARQGLRRRASAGEEEMIHLKKGREKSLKRRHPGIFSGAIEKVPGKPAAGDTVEVKGPSGEALALAAYSPDSQIRARVWSFDSRETIDKSFFERRLQSAVSLRAQLPAARHSNAARLVHGESDGLPGLVVDRYADVLVAQFLSAGLERWRDPIPGSLVRITGFGAIFSRFDAP